MGRQVSQTKEAAELGPNAYEVSDESKGGRRISKLLHKEFLDLWVIDCSTVGSLVNYNDLELCIYIYTVYILNIEAYIGSLIMLIIVLFCCATVGQFMSFAFTWLFSILYLCGFFQLRTFLQSKTGEGIMIQDSPDAIKNMKLGKEVVVYLDVEVLWYGR